MGLGSVRCAQRWHEAPKNTTAIRAAGADGTSLASMVLLVINAEGAGQHCGCLTGIYAVSVGPQTMLQKGQAAGTDPIGFGACVIPCVCKSRCSCHGSRGALEV